MSASPHSETDLLLAHGAWIRALARKLVADEHRAEDLVQETWLAALRHRADPVRAFRPWLAGILANLTRRDRRRNARREEHEQLASRETEAPSAADAVESAALGRDLADLVLGLEEPFRTTILLRYYEDLPPRAIARRMDVPVRTVNSRLARGLERLRSKVQRRDGSRVDWLSSWILLAPRPEFVSSLVGSSARDVCLGVVWMNAKHAVAIAAAIVLTAGALVWTLSPGPETAVAKSTGTATASALEVEARPSAELAPPSAEPEALRTPGASPATPAVGAAAAVEAPLRRIRGRVLDPDAIPLAGIEVVFRGGSDPAPRAVSGAGGYFELDAPPHDGSVAATDPALVNVSVGIVRMGREVEPLVVVAPGHDLGGRVVDPSGAPLTGAIVALEPPEGFMRRFDAVLDATKRYEADATTDAAGNFVLPGVPHIPGARVVARLDGFANGSVEAPPGDDLQLVVELAHLVAEGQVLAGTVVDAHGQAVAGAYVSLGERSTVTDSAGEFRLETAGAEQALELVAVHPGHLPGRATAERDPATKKPVWPAILVLRLGGRPLTLTGRVVDQKDEPRARLRLWLADPTRFGILGEDDVATVESMLGRDGVSGDDYWRWCETDEDGRFALGGLLDREYRIGLIDPHTAETLELGPHAAGGPDLTLRFPRAPLRRITGRVLSTRGHPVAGASLSLSAHTFGGISTFFDSGSRISDAEGRYVFEDVGGQDLRMWVQGDDIVPVLLGVPGTGPDGVQELDVTVSVRCHFKVHVTSGTVQADAVRMLDVDGGMLDLLRVAPGGVTTGKQASLVDGRSEALGVVDRAWTLLLLKNGSEVRRLDVRLVPGQLNLIEL